MLDLLRKETRALHNELEAITESSKMKEDTYTLEDYQRYILANYHFHRAVEQNLLTCQEDTFHALLLQYRRKTPYLLRDLHALQINIAESSFTLSGDSLPHKVGYMYVAEGSMLGVALIRKLLKTKPHFQEEGFHFLNCYKNHKSELWVNFKSYVNARDWNRTERTTAVNAAKDAFLLYKDIHCKISHKAEC